MTRRGYRCARTATLSLYLSLGIGGFWHPSGFAEPVDPAEPGVTSVATSDSRSSSGRTADRAPGASPLVYELHFEGAIGPASERYLFAGLDAAARDGADALLLRLDTPGGLDTSMRAIIKRIVSAPQPVLLFVHPPGSRAASAGTYMLYASHVAAMAPGTNLGAATPVALGGGGFPGGSGERDPPADEDATGDAVDGSGTERAGEDGTGEAVGGRGSRPPEAKSASEAKVTNDAIAYIRSLAELRGRDAEWAEAAVRDAQSLSATEALARGVIDFVAVDAEDLLRQATGHEVQVSGERRVLDLAGARIEPFAQSWQNRVLAVITDPNVALLLMAIGFYGLVFEFMNPGALVPGTVGGISLLLGLYSLSVLPLRLAGIALMLLGLVLMLGEAFMPSFGVLGIGGVAAFVLGAMLLSDGEAPGFELAWPVVLGIAATGVLFSVVVVRTAYRSGRRPVVAGKSALIGREGTVIDWSGHAGHVFADGERWSARSEHELAKGQAVTVTAVTGIELSVTPRPVAPSEPGRPHP